MKVATADEMRRIDERTQAEYGISGDDLMARAGAAVARLARERFAPQRVCVVCGKGNNGGDGFVAALELHRSGVAVEGIALSPPEILRGPAARACAQLMDALPLSGPERLPEALRAADLVVDAILGIGARGAASGLAAEAIEAINRAGRPVLAVDVPSGLTEPAAPDQPMVRATATVTIGLPKLALLTLPGWSMAGELFIEPIQFPDALLRDDSLPHNWLTAPELAGALPLRPPDSNKGDFGRVGIVAGSAPFAGAALLAARGALRAGCGLVYLFTTRELNPIFKAALPEAVSVLVPSGLPDWLDESGAGAILEKAATLDALAIGPGLGTAPGQQALVRRLVSEIRSVPLVLDADALTCLAPAAGQPGNSLLSNLLAGGRTDCVLTPHPGEMARLLGQGATARDVQKDRIAVARAFAREHGVNLLLKGASTVVARPDGQVFLSPGAAPALAKGGTGDVLTGAIAALIAQGVEPWKAAVLGAGLHLEAGLSLERRDGPWGVLAGEVADEIPRVMQRLACAAGAPS